MLWFLSVVNMGLKHYLETFQEKSKYMKNAINEELNLDKLDDKSGKSDKSNNDFDEENVF